MQINAKIPQRDIQVDSELGKRVISPIRSVYSYMQTRHNVMTKEQADHSNAQANNKNIYRIYQWNENTQNQSYDKIPITGKIGSN